MKVFLTGATGYIGSVVAEELQKAGHRVIGLARNQAAADLLASRHIEPVIGDVRTPAPLAQQAKEADGVIHTAFLHEMADFAEASRIDGDLIEALGEALVGTNKPLVVSSASGVLGDTGDQSVDETASIPRDFGPAVRAASEDSAWKVAERNVRSSVIRLPAFPHGRGGSVLVPLLIQSALRSGTSYYIGTGENKTSAVHVEDAARLYVLALEKAPAGSLYHAASESSLTIKSIADSIARLTGRSTASLSQEQAFTVLGGFVGTLLAINSQLNGTKARNELGWQPTGLSLFEDIEHGTYRQFVPQQ